MSPTIIIIALGVPILFWCTLLLLISAIAGWRRLAKRFRTDAVPRGERFRFSSIHFGWWGGYNNCISGAVNEQGIFLSVFPPFRPGHPPLLVPWREIDDVSTQPFFFSTVTKVVIRNFPRPLLIPRAFGKAILEARPVS